MNDGVIFHFIVISYNFRLIMQVGGQFRTQNVEEVACLRGQASNMIRHRTLAKLEWSSLHSGSHTEGEQSCVSEKMGSTY
jgi:hypothetical protein